MFTFCGYHIYPYEGGYWWRDAEGVEHRAPDAVAVKLSVRRYLARKFAQRATRHSYVFKKNQ